MAVTVRSCSYAFTYDVFLSFKGEDTRHSFTGNLYKHLHDRGIHTFIDDVELQRGEEIKPSLLKAIEESRIAIPVLSNNYASSAFCLDELTTILHCAERKGGLVLPVFYKVSPSEVRHQSGSYGEALARHEERFKAEKEKFNHNMERLEKWKMALHRVANCCGYHLRGDEYEHEFIGNIVELVSSKIDRAPLPVADYPVGLESRVLEIRKLLDVGSHDGVHMIGIHGIGGVGKSTLARAVYNLIADDFDGSCFLENVREKSRKHGLQHLQSILLLEILGEKKIKLTSVEQRTSMIQRRLQRKKVLLVLDDVDEYKQLQTIVGRPDWFGPGSRVIVTTRDKQLLASYEIKITYMVKKLNNNDALQLLKWRAFKNKKVDPGYVEVLNGVVTYACGLPLALEVIGSNLYGKSIEEWKSAIKKYKRIPNNQILKVLKVSFDALEEEEKNVFLDIACCFKGYELTEVENILHAHYGNCMKYHIGLLVEKSLVKLCYGEVTLHDLMEDMGKEIERRKSPKEPGRRTRLWLPEDIILVLEDNSGTSEIQTICLDIPRFDMQETVQWNKNAFKKMKNLKTLIIKNVHLSESPKYLPNSLRVLEWWSYPSQCLPSDFHPRKLVICKLPDSCFTSPQLAGLLKKFVNVRVLNFDDCLCLTHIPDISGLPSLENLSFKYCERLLTVHGSIGLLDKLKILSAFGCKNLTSFPPLKLISLEKLELSYCSSLERFPEIIGKMQSIREVWLHGTPIKELPFSFRNLIGLRELYLLDCEVVHLPSSIITMPELTLIHASGWKGWQWLKQEEGEEKVVGSIVSSKVECLYALECNLHDDFFSIDFTWFAYVKKLYLWGNNFTILPECIKECQFLCDIEVRNCKQLREIRGIPPKLKYFNATNCESLSSSSTSMLLNQDLHEAGNTLFYLPGVRIPEWFNHQSRGRSISFWFRNKFPDKVLCLVIAPMDNDSGWLSPRVLINGNKCSVDSLNFLMGKDHTYVFDLKKIQLKNMYEGPFENEWNHAQITCEGWSWKETSIPIKIGIHLFNQESSMKDIRQWPQQFGITKPPVLLKRHRFVDMEVS